MNIVVTGTSRGIGFEVVKHLSKDLKNRIFALSRDNEEVRKYKISKELENIIPIQVDLSNDESISKCIETIKSTASGIELLINMQAISKQAF
jgi:NAD(P)-dependent dehydrogenase (short-subunit alcohol dehydrogenase family)